MDIILHASGDYKENSWSNTFLTYTSFVYQIVWAFRDKSHDDDDDDDNDEYDNDVNNYDDELQKL